MLAFPRTYKLAIKKATPKTKRDNHGKESPNAAARKHNT